MAVEAAGRVRGAAPPGGGNGGGRVGSFLTQAMDLLRSPQSHDFQKIGLIRAFARTPQMGHLDPGNIQPLRDLISGFTFPAPYINVPGLAVSGLRPSKMKTLMEPELIDAPTQRRLEDQVMRILRSPEDLDRIDQIDATADNRLVLLMIEDRLSTDFVNKQGHVGMNQEGTALFLVKVSVGIVRIEMQLAAGAIAAAQPVAPPAPRPGAAPPPPAPEPLDFRADATVVSRVAGFGGAPPRPPAAGLFALSPEAERLKDEIDRHLGSAQALADRLAGIRRERARLEQDRDSARDLVGDQEQKIVDLQGTIARKEKELQRARERQGEEEATLKTAMGDLGNIGGEIEAAASAYDALAAELRGNLKAVIEGRLAEIVAQGNALLVKFSDARRAILSTLDARTRQVGLPIERVTPKLAHRARDEKWVPKALREAKAKDAKPIQVAVDGEGGFAGPGRFEEVLAPFSPQTFPGYVGTGATERLETIAAQARAGAEMVERALSVMAGERLAAQFGDEKAAVEAAKVRVAQLERDIHGEVNKFEGLDQKIEKARAEKRAAEAQKDQAESALKALTDPEEVKGVFQSTLRLIESMRDEARRLLGDAYVMDAQAGLNARLNDLRTLAEGETKVGKGAPAAVAPPREEGPSDADIDRALGALDAFGPEAAEPAPEPIEVVPLDETPPRPGAAPPPLPPAAPPTPVATASGAPAPRPTDDDRDYIDAALTAGVPDLVRAAIANLSDAGLAALKADPRAKDLPAEIKRELGIS